MYNEVYLFILFVCLENQQTEHGPGDKAIMASREKGLHELMPMLTSVRSAE